MSVCLSEPPNTAINDLVDVFRQPSHVVSLTLSPLPREVEEEEVERRKSSRAVSMDFRGWQHTSGALREQRRGPVASPQASRRPKLSGKEMDKLLAQLDEVSQSLERTQTQCEAIARRCEGRARQLSEDTDDASDDSRVERLLRVAENLTAQIIHQQHLQQQGSPRGAPCVCGCGGVCLYVCLILLAVSFLVLHERMSAVLAPRPRRSRFMATCGKHRS